MNLAPIALFVYNRPEHTKITLDSLARNEYANRSELFIFADGPKNGKNIDSLNEVRSIIKNVSGFKNITIVERERNYGLANSIIAGVTELTEKFGRVIVLEDDMVTSKFFLTFLNQGLNYYEKENRVISIHAYRLPFVENAPETYFLRGADCWGWATWKRGWSQFESNGQKLLDQLTSKNLNYDFDFQGSYPYIQMLKDQILAKNDSWAIRWYASAFLQDKLTLYPGRSLVQNIGLDASGTHCLVTDEYDVDLSISPIRIGSIEIKENVEIRDFYKKYFYSLRHAEPKGFTRAKIFLFLKQTFRNMFDTILNSLKKL
ncbi:glycosyltransferase [Leptospira kmetyi]|uniref:Glycosyltransferase n=1 Tax=Leptospira kmetyi TaxID=408139 RepID=A0AAD0UW46_9LEPT|nr:glycosyltransferase [Leptospira kmetyi]